MKEKTWKMELPKVPQIYIDLDIFLYCSFFFVPLPPIHFLFQIHFSYWTLFPEQIAVCYHYPLYLVAGTMDWTLCYIILRLQSENRFGSARTTANIKFFAIRNINTRIWAADIVKDILGMVRETSKSSNSKILHFITPPAHFYHLIRFVSSQFFKMIALLHNWCFDPNLKLVF